MKKYLRVALGVPKHLLSNAYMRFFSRSSMQSLNDSILNLALHARGYNNFKNARLTGEEEFLRLLARHQPTFCIDIGANRGEYSRRLLATTQAKVVAFEPLPKAFVHLVQIKRDFSNRFECVNKGVGDRCAVLKLHYGAEDSLHASFSSEVSAIDYVGRSNVNALSVDVVTLDSYLENRPPEPASCIDLIKIDTEGFEFEVLSGARSTIEKYRPKFIQLEFNLHQLFRGQSLWSIACLLPLYRLYQLMPYDGGMIPRDPKSPLSNIYQYSNFVFVRGDVQL